MPFLLNSNFSIFKFRQSNFIETILNKLFNCNGNFPNPWQRNQQQRQRNIQRGRPLGNIKGVKDTQSVQHRGGRGG